MTKALATAAVNLLPQLRRLRVPEKGSWKEADKEELVNIYARKKGLSFYMIRHGKRQRDKEKGMGAKPKRRKNNI